MKAGREEQSNSERDEGLSGADQPGLTDHTRGEEGQGDRSGDKKHALLRGEALEGMRVDASVSQQCPENNQSDPAAALQKKPARKLPWSWDSSACPESTSSRLAELPAQEQSVDKQRTPAADDEQRVNRGGCEIGEGETALGQGDLSRTSNALLSEAAEQQGPSHTNQRQLGGRDPVNQSSSREKEQAIVGNEGDQLPDHEVGLEGVDLAEQRKIMREIWMQSQLGNSGVSAKKRQTASRPEKGPKQPRLEKGPKQPRLTDMFKKSAA